MIRAYFGERLPPLLFVPLSVVIAGAAAGGDYVFTTLALDTLAAWLLLAELRLWDDLADRPADALTHPRRVLVAAPSTRPFVRVCFALGLANVAWTVLRAGIGLSLAILVMLHAALGAWYARRKARTLAGDQLLLAKYPALVLLLAGHRLAHMPVAVVLSAAAIYVVASVYEAWHDPVSPLAAFLGGRS